MKFRSLMTALHAALLSILLAASPVSAGSMTLLGAGGNSGVCSQATNFLARTSGLDATHTTAYTNLICGLVADGVFSKLDVLHIYATQDSTTALLNLVSSSFNGTANGSPTFTADRGFTGVASSSTVFINTNFNPASGSPQYTQNSSHLSEWNLTDAQSNSAGVGSIGTHASYILARFTDDNAYFRINAVESGNNVPSVSSIGHFLANRSSSSAMEGYKNGSSIFSSGVTTSFAVENQNFFSLGFNTSGTARGVGRQVASISIGGALNSTDALNFYTRERTYMTAVGVP